MGSLLERSSAMVDNFTSGETDALPRRPIHAAAYERRSRERPCFVCETLAGNPDYPAHLVWTDDDSVALLARYNTLLGHTLVGPPSPPRAGHR
jgi:hypothetical protein